MRVRTIPLSFLYHKVYKGVKALRNGDKNE
jgi:hypothetical protein